jgi:hypothetical protein
MPTQKTGYADSYHQARVSHLTGTSYPAPLTTPYIGLYLNKLPLSDGSGASDVARMAVTWTAAALDPVSSRWYIQPTASLAFVLPAGVTGSGLIMGWGVFAAASGGTPAYVDVLPPSQVLGGQTITLQPWQLRAWAEGNSLAL